MITARDRPTAVTSPTHGEAAGGGAGVTSGSAGSTARTASHESCHTGFVWWDAMEHASAVRFAAVARVLGSEAARRGLAAPGPNPEQKSPCPLLRERADEAFSHPRHFLSCKACPPRRTTARWRER